MYEGRDMRSISEKYADAFIKDDSEEEYKCSDCNELLKPNKDGKYFKRCYDCGVIHKETFKYKCSMCFIPMEKDYPTCFKCGELKRQSYKYKCKVCDKKMEKNFPTCFPCRKNSGKV